MASYVKLSILWFSLIISVAHAAQSFVGSNLYYGAGLTESEQQTLFTGLQSAGVRVLRVWLDGRCHNTLGCARSRY